MRSLKAILEVIVYKRMPLKCRLFNQDTLSFPKVSIIDLDCMLNIEGFYWLSNKFVHV